MKHLKILDLYTNSDEKKVDTFSQRLDSSFEIAHDYSEYIYDDEWIDEVEKGIRFVNNILGNPNKFIINEEEIVKVELARRITVDSVKHLSKNTNLIQDIDEETGDVKPSKILNINKEDSYNTYENRFIYSLIKSIEMYIYRKKQLLNDAFNYKNEKRMQYSGVTKVEQEDIDIAINYNSKLSNDAGREKIEKILERIKKLELLVANLKRTELYMTLEKANVAIITSPIKKTNVILKNTNFQGAVNLWNYLQTHIEDRSKVNKGNEVLKNDSELKDFVDEAFIINYLIANSLDEKDVDSKKKKYVSEYLVNNFIQKVVTTNDALSKKELTDMVGKQFTYVKNQKLSESTEIKRIFKEAIKNYKKSINEIKL